MRPKTAEQYIELIKNAKFEIEEVRMAAEYDMDSMGDALNFIDELESGLQNMINSMKEGSYKFVDEDLPFMNIVASQDDSILPIKYLLRTINETHREGLDTEED